MPSRSLKTATLTLLLYGAKKILDRVLRRSSAPTPIPAPSPSDSAVEENKIHPWRLCPSGEHWRRTHPRTVPVTEKNPDGMTIVRGHCVKSPGGKEIFESDEFREIASRYFKALQEDPNVLPGLDDFEFKDVGNQYDLSIAGWTKFWNEVFRSKKPLDPDWVKALVASESGFRSSVRNSSQEGAVRGLIQVTDKTRRILKDPKGEIRNFHIHIENMEDLTDPDVNLATGIRWLFHKKSLLENRSKREVTWEEAMAEYKGVSKQRGKNKKADQIMEDLRKYYERLKRSRRKPSF